MNALGYRFLHESLRLGVFAPERPALVKPVTRVERTDGFLAIPRSVAPASDNPIEHLLFALKHEGVNLQILAEALPKIDPTTLLSEARRLPTGTYIRMACYLWEQFTGKRLTELPEIAGPTVELFDPRRYVTGPPRRDARWRVAFNGLGTTSYCPTVRRTDRIEAAIRSDILGRAKAFADALGKSCWTGRLRGHTYTRPRTASPSSVKRRARIKPESSSHCCIRRMTAGLSPRITWSNCRIRY